MLLCCRPLLASSALTHFPLLFSCLMSGLALLPYVLYLILLCALLLQLLMVLTSSSWSMSDIWMPVLLQILHPSYFLYTLSKIMLSCGFGCILSNYPTTATKCSRQITWSEPGSAGRERVNFYLVQSGTTIYCKKTWINVGGFGHAHSRLPLSVQSAQKWRVRDNQVIGSGSFPSAFTPLHQGLLHFEKMPYHNSTTLSTEKNWQISSVFCIIVSFLSSISMCFFTPMMVTRRWEIFWVLIELANNHDTN